jgi:hypothetical protein
MERSKLGFQIVTDLISGKSVKQIVADRHVPAMTVYRAWHQAYDAGMPGLRKPRATRKSATF